MPYREKLAHLVSTRHDHLAQFTNGWGAVPTFVAAFKEGDGGLRDRTFHLVFGAYP